MKVLAGTELVTYFGFSKMSEDPDDPDADFHRYPSDDELASSMTEHIYELAHRVVNDDVLIGELGFANREAIGDIVIAIRAGDRLHPRLGFDYLGADWKEISKDRRFKQHDERRDEVEAILESVHLCLERDGYEAAREFTLTSSPFQVIYLSRSETETRRNLDTLLSLGLGRNELSDNLCEKRGCNLVFGYDENISYFCPTGKTRAAGLAMRQALRRDARTRAIRQGPRNAKTQRLQDQ